MLFLCWGAVTEIQMDVCWAIHRMPPPNNYQAAIRGRWELSNVCQHTSCVDFFFFNWRTKMRWYKFLIGHITAHLAFDPSSPAPVWHLGTRIHVFVIVGNENPCSWQKNIKTSPATTETQCYAFLAPLPLDWYLLGLRKLEGSCICIKFFLGGDFCLTHVLHEIIEENFTLPVPTTRRVIRTIWLHFGGALMLSSFYMHWTLLFS